MIVPLHLTDYICIYRGQVRQKLLSVKIHLAMSIVECCTYMYASLFCRYAVADKVILATLRHNDSIKLVLSPRFYLHFAAPEND